MLKKFAVLALVVVFLVPMFLSGCGGKQEAANSGSSDNANVIKIGVFEPMTGANAAGGQMTMEGINLANEKYPEVLGKKIQIVLVDNKSDQTEAANAVARLIEQEKVKAIIGSYGSSVSMAAGPIVKQAGVPAVGCSPTNPMVTQGNEYYFRVCFIDPFQGKVMAKYAANDLKAKKAAIIVDMSSDYSMGLANFFKKSFVELTGDQKAIVGESKYKTGDQDFTAQLESIKSLKPDVIFAPGNYGESALLIKQAREMGITVPFLGGDTWEAPEFIQIGGKAVEGATFSTHFTAEAPVTEVSTEFMNAYRAKYNKEPNAFAALGFDAYLVIRDAIERAGTDDSKAIRDALAQTKDFKGATGIITLDENRNANKSAVIKQVKDGKFKFLSIVQPD